jgi:hypothetical protein
MVYFDAITSAIEVNQLCTTVGMPQKVVILATAASGRV